MPTNEGTTDRILRGIAGIVLLALAFATSILTAPILFWGAIIVGAVMLLTAVTGFCPMYRVLGIKTCTDC